VPLVSGAAIVVSGQWAVYGGLTPKGKKRACYRCLWPEVLSGTGRDRCDELGVLGMVTGLVGCGMAGEVVRLLIGTAGERNLNFLGRVLRKSDEDPLLHFVKMGGTPMVRSVRMRGPRKLCLVCGDGARIPDDLEEMGYEAFCAGPGVSTKGNNGRSGLERIGVKVGQTGRVCVSADQR